MNRITLSPRIRMTPYHRSVVEAGVSDISVYNKMVMPTSYGDLKAEYERLINSVAIWDVSVERQVEVSGPDADVCAQYFTSRDISKMVEGQGKYVAMCDHAGIILNDPVLMKLSGNRYWFSIGDNDMLLWCKGIAAERGWDVEVTEPDVSPLAVQGPKAEDLVAELFGEHIRDLKYFWFVETELEGIPLVLCRSGWSKQGGFELFLQDGSRGNDLYKTIMAAGAKYDIGPGAPNHIERVESGLLSYGGDNTPDSNPLEAGMGRYVDTDTDVEYIGKAALQADRLQPAPRPNNRRCPDQAHGGRSRLDRHDRDAGGRDVSHDPEAAVSLTNATNAPPRSQRQAFRTRSVANAARAAPTIDVYRKNVCPYAP